MPVVEGHVEGRVRLHLAALQYLKTFFMDQYKFSIRTLSLLVYT